MRPHVFRPEATVAYEKLKLYEFDRSKLFLPSTFVLTRRTIAQESGWSLVREDGSIDLSVASPIEESQKDLEKLGSDLKRLKLERKITSQVKLMTTVAEAEPVFFWDFLKYGKPKFFGHLLLATMKYSMLADADEVIVHQRGDYEFIVTRSPKRGMTLIDISSHRTNLFQWIVVAPKPDRERAYIDSILNTYELTESSH